MFGKLVDGMKSAGGRGVVKKRAFRCPDCGAASEKPRASIGQVMECGVCGTKASRREWASNPMTRNLAQDATKLPMATKVRKDSAVGNSATWHIPASGKFGFFLFFAVFWLLITGAVSGGFLLTFLNGGEIEGDFPGWVLIPFFAIFWAIGLGVLYAAIRQKYMSYRLTLADGRVTLRKEMFGRVNEKSVAASSVTSISQQVFYSQNYQPVYGIEIRGADGKLRFGTALPGVDKAWLVADVKETLDRGREESAPGESSILEPMKLKRAKEVFSVEIPRPRKSAIFGSLIFALIGIGFVCAGIFLMGGDTDSGFFRVIWTLVSSLFAVIGIAMSIATLKRRGEDRRIEGNSAEISLRTYRRGLVAKDRSFARHEVSDIRTSESGHNNGTPMKRVELIVGDKVVKLASWMDGGDADALASEVREALGKSD